MELFPADLYQFLDFPFIRERLAALCSNRSAKDQALALEPFREREDLETAIRESDQILALLLSEERFPNAEFPEVKDFIAKLKVRGNQLEEKQFADLRTLFLNYRHLYLHCKNKKERLPALWDKLQFHAPEEFILKEIDRVLDERAIVRSSASPELARIRRDLGKKRAAADRIFQRVLKRYQSKGYLAEFDQSVSENRRVLAIQSAYKGQVQGILHGSSNKHSISFFEPGETVEINNEIAALQEAEGEEIKRILRELTALIAPYHDHLNQLRDLLLWLDFTRAKALYAENEEACYPALSEEMGLELREAYNPVLRHFNAQKEKQTVPLSLKLDPEQRLLVISGPNAGGKSLSLKTVGLLQLMLQCGLAVPVHPDSRFCLFDRILGDIGDAQSIENELSTYSSKLKKMEHFLNYSDGHSLLLIDEFGSGSDPELGSALAQVFLERLNAYGAYGVLTTHFNAIKALAAETAGVVNGAMLFDQRTFDPKYELQVGQPGSSYTFEVAQRSGIAKHLIEDARGRIQQNTLEVDRLLVQIQSDKLELEKLKGRREKELQKLRKMEKIQQERIDQLEEKLSKHTKLNEENDRLIYWGKRFQKLIDSWMEQKTQKDKKEVVARFIAMLNQRSGEVEQKEKKEHGKNVQQHHKDLQKYLAEKLGPNDEVRLLQSGVIGKILEQKGEKYLISLNGNMTALVARDQFIRASASLGKKPKRKKRPKSFKPKGQQKPSDSKESPSIKK